MPLIGALAAAQLAQRNNATIFYFATGKSAYRVV
jgi:hypothetical protein